MAEEPENGQLDTFLEIRKPGAHLEEGVVEDEFVLMLGVDLTNFPKFPRVDDDVTYPKGALDIRDQLDVDSGAELPDYGGPYRGDLRFTDFSVEALSTRFLPWAEAYREACIDVGRGGGPAVRRRDDGRDRVGGLERPDGPGRERMAREFLPPGPSRGPQPGRPPRTGSLRVSSTRACSHRAPMPPALEDPARTWLLGSHEYLLQCIEGWAAQIVVRYGLDTMFDVQWALWGDTVLPMAKRLKAEYLGITGNTVADWMKDLQVDATAMPGKAFDVSSNARARRRDHDVQPVRGRRPVGDDGRPDILEKNCHSTCPKSMIVTTGMYNPNMKVDILAIPPRRDPGTCAASGVSACATRAIRSTSP